MRVAVHVVDPTSLVSTVDNLTNILLRREVLPNAQRREIAEFIVSRIDQRGGYHGLPAPTEKDYARPFHVFTGEKITSGAGRSHVLGEEAFRAAMLADVHTADIVEPLDRANRSMLLRLEYGDKLFARPAGMFCCAMCSVSFWRALTACCYDQQDDRLRHGLSVLRESRTANGRWKRFPFYYTLLALLDMHVIEAQDELEHAAGAVEKLLRTPAKCVEPYATRRRILLERVAERCDVTV